MVNRAKRLTGLNPLAYLGVEPLAPVPFYTAARNPTSSDWQSFDLGTVWLNTTSMAVFFLASLDQNQATWILLGMSGGDVQTLTGNDAVTVSPDGAGNINIVTAGSSVGFLSGVNSLVLDFGISNLLLGATGANITTGLRNVGLGDDALEDVTTGDDNVAVGVDALNQITTGDRNIALGTNAGSTYTTESDNIVIGVSGIAADNGVIRIGTTPPVGACFIAGIAGVAVANTALVTIDTTTGQLGSTPVIGPVTGTATTVGAVTADVITINMGAIPGTLSMEARVAAFESTTPAGAAYDLLAGTRTTGIAASLIGTVDQVVNEDAALTAANATIVVSGNNAIVRVTGVAGLTINWSALIEYTTAQ